MALITSKIMIFLSVAAVGEQVLAGPLKQASFLTTHSNSTSKREVKHFPQESNMPTGTVVAFAGAYEPIGWVFCDGRSLSRLAYRSLFGIIGSTFGAGDGSTTFNIPDFRQRFLLGGATLAENSGVGGEQEVTLTETQMPSHSHDVGLPLSTKDGGSQWVFENHPAAVGTVMPRTGGAGGGQPHNNMPPYVKIGWIIKT